MNEVRVNQVYRSNRGNGPLRAKVTTLFSDGRVRLYRWDERGSDARRVYFTLTERYLRSPRCGWKKQPHAE